MLLAHGPLESRLSLGNLRVAPETAVIEQPGSGELVSCGTDKALEDDCLMLNRHQGFQTIKAQTRLVLSLRLNAVMLAAMRF